MAAKKLKAPYLNLPYHTPNEVSAHHPKPALPESAKVVLGVRLIQSQKAKAVASAMRVEGNYP